METISLLALPFQIRVSTVLNRDTLSYGKQLLVDNNNETCWCSDQGSPQWFALAFQDTIKVSDLHIQFQGGFVGKDCQLELIESNRYKKVLPFYPEDNNLLQKFKFDEEYPCQKIVVNFLSSTDFYGRIVIYKIDIYGNKL